MEYIKNSKSYLSFIVIGSVTGIFCCVITHNLPFPNGIDDWITCRICYFPLFRIQIWI